MQIVEFTQATFKFFVETFHFTITKLIHFLQQFADGFLNLVLQAVELLEGVVDQLFDL